MQAMQVDGRDAGPQQEPVVQIRKVSEDFCDFVLSNTGPSMANALRRVIMAEVGLPAPAFALLAPWTEHVVPVQFSSARSTPRRSPPSRLSWWT